MGPAATVGGRGRWLALIAASLGWLFDGFEMGLHPLIAHPALRELLTPSVIAELGPNADPTEVAARLGAAVGQWYAILTALFLFGAAAGGVLFGWLGDRIGRTRALAFCVLTYAILTGLGGFATAVWQLAVLRFLAALGMGGEWSLGVALVMEVWPASARPLLAGVIGAVGNLGYLLVAVVSTGVNTIVGDGAPTWRPLMFVGVAPAFLTFLIRLAVPESPKWQAAVAAPPSLSSSSAIPVGRRCAMAALIMGVALLGTWGAVQWIPMWAAELGGASHRNAKEYAQACAAAGACIGTILAALLAGRFGRRPTYFVLCLLSLVATAWLFRTPQTFGPEFLAGVFAVGFVTAAFYGWAPLYLPELFPTRVRAMAQGTSYNFGRIFAGVGTLMLTGRMMEQFQADLPATLAVTSLVYVVGLGLIWLSPETKGRPLPD